MRIGCSLLLTFLSYMLYVNDSPTLGRGTSEVLTPTSMGNSFRVLVSVPDTYIVGCLPPLPTFWKVGLQLFLLVVIEGNQRLLSTFLCFITLRNLRRLIQLFLSNKN